MPNLVPKDCFFLTDRSKVELDVDIDYGVFTSADPWRALITVVYLSTTGTARQDFVVPIVEFQATATANPGTPVPAKVVLQLTGTGADGTRPGAAVALSNPGHTFDGYYTP